MEPSKGGKRWRREVRKDLINARLAAGRPQRDRWNAVIETRLRELLAEPEGRVFGLCWPFKGEFDAREVAGDLVKQGGRAALPVVVRPREPLEFWRWKPGDPIERGAYQIPIPRARQVVQPDVLLVPLVGFDAGCYRLGYGSGYFDRTIAAMGRKPLAIGLGYELSRLDTIFPRSHDIPMDYIVTEEHLLRRPVRPRSVPGQ